MKDRDRLLDELDAYPVKAVINVLFSGICRTDSLLRWNSITMMGVMVGRLADQQMEAARVIMRRFLWSLNDESGGIGWGAPESMAEACCAHAGIAKEYLHMLISYMHEDGEELCQDGNYLEHLTLQRGLLWGIARVASCRPQLLRQRGVGPEVAAYLDSPDAEVRGLATLTVGLLRYRAALPQLEWLQRDASILQLFLHGEFCQVTVAELAEEALARMEEEVV